VPSPRKNVSLPARNEGSHEECCTSTTTWNSPLAASNRFRSVMDFKSTGPLRVVVVSPKGLPKWIKLVRDPTNPRITTIATPSTPQRKRDDRQPPPRRVSTTMRVSLVEPSRTCSSLAATGTPNRSYLMTYGRYPWTREETRGAL